VQTEGHGLPIAVAIEGANRHDVKLLEPTLQAIMVPRPQATDEQPQGMCLDAAYDSETARQTLRQWGYTAHIRSRGQERDDKQKVPGYRARRWVVERAHSWMNRYRRLLIRWEKKPDNYLAMLHLACACICFRAAWVSG
jgi:transposase